MTIEEKIYIDLIDDVNSGEISIIDAKDILGDKYIRWLRAYNSYNEARKAYKEYQLALENYKKHKSIAEKSAGNATQLMVQWQQLYKEKEALDKKYGLHIMVMNFTIEHLNRIDALRAAKTKEEKKAILKERLNTQQEKITAGILKNKIEAKMQTDPLFANRTVAIPDRLTDTGEPLSNYGVKTGPLTFKEMYEMVSKYELELHTLSEQGTAAYKKWEIDSKLAEQAKLKADIAEVNYQDYTLLKIIGIL